MKRENDIKNLLGHLIGTANTLSNNILFIDFTGSHEKAQLLSQMWYWSSRTKMKGGWFCKTHDEWYQEIRIKRHSVRRYCKEFTEMGFLQSKLKKFDGIPKPHYLLDKDELIRQLVTFCEGNNLSLSHEVTIQGNNLSPSMEGNSVSPSTNIDLHRLNTEIRENAQNETNEDAALTEEEVLQLKEKFIVECNGLQIWPKPEQQPEPLPPSSAPPPSPQVGARNAPSVEDMAEYLEDLFLQSKWQPRFRQNPPETAEEIHDYYTANGWKVGRNPMKDWKAACRNWLKNNRNYGPRQQQKQPARLVSEDTHRRALAITLAELGVTGS